MKKSKNRKNLIFIKRKKVKENQRIYKNNFKVLKRIVNPT